MAPSGSQIIDAPVSRMFPTDEAEALKIDEKVGL